MFLCFLWGSLCCLLSFASVCRSGCGPFVIVVMVIGGLLWGVVILVVIVPSAGLGRCSVGERGRWKLNSNKKEGLLTNPTFCDNSHKLCKLWASRST